jgi:hypothetical protein
LGNKGRDCYRNGSSLVLFAYNGEASNFQKNLKEKAMFKDIIR